MSITIAKRLQHTEEYYFSIKLKEIEELNKQGKKVINLGIGSPDLPPHPSVIEALSHYAALPNTHGYQSYRGVTLLREAISKWYGQFYGVTLNAATEVLPLMGSKEGIMHICMTYLEEGDEALIPNPGYPTYSSAVRLTGATGRLYTLIEENQWLPDLKALAQEDLSKVKLMWVNYPHMPTGAAANRHFFEELVQFGKNHNILICHDNPYSFILTEEPTSLLSIDGAKDIVIELNSFSKSSNMAGWRIGMLLGAEARINEILRFKSNMDSGMFLPLQMAAVKALELDYSWYKDLNDVYRARREKAYRLLDLLHCTYDRSQVGLFVWAKIPTSYTDGYQLSDEVLHKAAVFITPGGIFGTEGNHYIRVSLCTTAEIFSEAIQRLTEHF